MKRSFVRSLLGTALLVCSTMSALVCAQDAPPGWPTRPIRLVLPVVPGGGMDILSRAIGQHMTERWGQSVIIDNRAGGGTVVATEISARSAPDGYTWFVASDTLRVLGVTKRVSFDVRKAFEPVVPMAGQPYILIVHPSLPVKDIKELIAHSHKQPLSFGSSGVGTVAHIGLEWFAGHTGAKFIHVPYKGGGQALTALMGAEIHMYPGLLLSAGGAIKAGKAKPLAALSLKRLPAMPDLPTVAEQGYANFKITNSYNIMAPVGTSKPLINAVNRLVGEFMHSAAMSQKLAAEGSQAGERMTPEEFKTAWLKEYDQVERQVKELKVKLY